MRSYFATFALIFAFSAPVRAQTGVVQDAELRAHLIYDFTGSISDNLIDNKDFIFFNAIIGEGSAIYPSHSVLIILVLRGQPGDFGNGSAMLTVRNADRGELVSRQVADVGGFSDSSGQSFVMFVLQGTGCAPLDLSVQLDPSLGGQHLTGSVPFYCGE